MNLTVEGRDISVDSAQYEESFSEYKGKEYGHSRHLSLTGKVQSGVRVIVEWASPLTASSGEFDENTLFLIGGTMDDVPDVLTQALKL